MSRVHHAIFFSAVERYGSMFLFIITAAVLSRLLTPEEFGIFAVVNAFMAVTSAAFQEIGGANYLIQKRVLSRQIIETAFTVTFCLSILVGAALFSLRDLLASVFSQPGMKIGIAVAALNFALTPFSMTLSALFRRDMDFSTLAICGLGGSVVGAAVAIALAALNFSYMAPIWGTIAGNAVTAMLLIVAWKDIRIFRLSLTGYRDVLGFGLYSSGVSVINVFYNMAPQLFLARILDFTAVGLYSRAINATQLFDKLVMQVLGPVILPAICAHAKSRVDLKRIYLDAIGHITAVQWPFLVFIAIMAHSIVWIWLGQTWMDVVPLVRLLCIASLALFAAGLTYPMLVAVGSVRDALVSSLIALPPSLALIFVAGYFGVQAVAASALLTLPFQAAVAIYFVGRHIAMTPSDLFNAIAKSGVITLSSSAGVLASAVLVEFQFVGAVGGLFLAGMAAAAGWWFGLVMTGHPLLGRLEIAASSLPFAPPKILFFNARHTVLPD